MLACHSLVPSRACVLHAPVHPCGLFRHAREAWRGTIGAARGRDKETGRGRRAFLTGIRGACSTQAETRSRSPWAGACGPFKERIREIRSVLSVAVRRHAGAHDALYRNHRTDRSRRSARIRLRLARRTPLLQTLLHHVGAADRGDRHRPAHAAHPARHCGQPAAAVASGAKRRGGRDRRYSEQRTARVRRRPRDHSAPFRWLRPLAGRQPGAVRGNAGHHYAGVDPGVVFVRRHVLQDSRNQCRTETRAAAPPAHSRRGQQPGDRGIRRPDRLPHLRRIGDEPAPQDVRAGRHLSPRVGRSRPAERLGRRARPGRIVHVLHAPRRQPRPGPRDGRAEHPELLPQRARHDDGCRRTAGGHGVVPLYGGVTQKPGARHVRERRREHGRIRVE